MMKVARNSLIAMSIFLAIIGCLAYYLRDVLYNAFSYNPAINVVIFGCIILGVIAVYSQLFKINSEFGMIQKYGRLTKAETSKLKLLKPIALYVSRNSNLISQSKVQTIISGVEKNLDDQSRFPKYISGILIFLGLLGTFWGLSHTIGNVANIIDNLGGENVNPAEAFESLKNSLKIPLAGMGVAFGCSLFGLAGSLVIGFLNTCCSRATDELLTFVEEWISRYTDSFDAVDNSLEYHGQVFSMGLLEKTIETIYAFQKQLDDFEENRISLLSVQKDVYNRVAHLSSSIEANQEMMKVIGANQAELQAITLRMLETDNPSASYEVMTKLDSIDTSLNKLLQDNVAGRNIMIKSLGNDIRMISKTLSALLKD